MNQRLTLKPAPNLGAKVMNYQKYLDIHHLRWQVWLALIFIDNQSNDRLLSIKRNPCDLRYVHVWEDSKQNKMNWSS